MTAATIQENPWTLADLRGVLDMIIEVLGDDHTAQLMAMSPPMDTDGMPHVFVRVETVEQLRLLRREIVSGQWCYLTLGAPSETSFSFHVRGIHLMGVVQS